MRDFEVITIVCTIIVCLVAIWGWLRERSKDSEQEGANDKQVEVLTAQFRSLETNMINGQESINSNISKLQDLVRNEIGGVYQRFESCRREEMTEIRRVDKRIDNVLLKGEKDD